MVALTRRKPAMILFSRPSCCLCHRARVVLAEKGIRFELYEVDLADPPEDLLDLNPYHSVPTLVDRDLVLYESRVIMEYLDERFPHPPLMPIDPVNRARFRLALYRIENDWYQLLPKIEGTRRMEADRARAMLRDGLTASAAVFDAKPFFLSDEFSLVDCTLAPLLWRLPHFGINLPPEARPVVQYGERVFSRPAFRHSLSAVEQSMRL